MQSLNMPSIFPGSETEADPIVRLVVALSARLTRARDLEVVPAIVEALDEIAEATKADSCQLIEFSQSGSVAEIYRSAKHGNAPVATDEGGVLEEWITDRLAGGETVSTALVDASLLGVPASASGQVICALVINVGHVGQIGHLGGASQPWPQPTIDRLQLLAQILGSALQGRRHESALRSSVAVIQELNARLRAENVYLKEEIKNYHDFDDIVGESAPLRVALTRVGLVAPTNSSVLLIGPTGTGKELFARALHERSRRHARPLVRVNCAALPPTLVESELFGHEKGAFTGAVGVRQGRFELADGGTIFLDEIGDLSLDVQVKFLRVLQEGEFERVGSSRTQRVDVRVIAATHQDLEAAVAEGRFRADLYYRLSVYPIRLPSLQERADDIPRLVWFFINRHQHELSRRITEVPPSVMQALQNHSWPGNVRELENVVERAMIATSGNVLQLDESLSVTKLAAPGADGNSADGNSAGGNSLDAVQRAHIESVLEGCGWRINGANNAAERLGIHPNTLRFRMKKLGVRRPTA